MTNTKFTEEELSVLGQKNREKLETLLAEGVIRETEEHYYFATYDDPFAEKPKHKLSVLEYVVWNNAALFYRGNHV